MFIKIKSWCLKSFRCVISAMCVDDCEMYWDPGYAWYLYTDTSVSWNASSLTSEHVAKVLLTGIYILSCSYVYS